MFRPSKVASPAVIVELYAGAAVGAAAYAYAPPPRACGYYPNPPCC